MLAGIIAASIVWTFVYFAVLYAIWLEVKQKNPFFWRYSTIPLFIKTFWAWPALAVYIGFGLAWELWKNRKEFAELRRQRDSKK